MKNKIITFIALIFGTMVTGRAQTPDITAYDAIVNPAPITDSNQPVSVSFKATNTGAGTVPYSIAVQNGAVKITASITGLKPNSSFNPANDIAITSVGSSTNVSGISFSVTYLPNSLSFVFQLTSTWPPVLSAGALQFTISNLRADTVSTAANPLSGVNVNVNAIGAYNLSTSNDNAYSDTYATTSGIPLPLDIISFMANKRSCGLVNLNWQSAPEMDLSHFDIEYSSNGKNFAIVKTVEARQPLSESDYFTTIKQADELGYYRLKLIYFNQSYRYSTIQSVAMDCFNNPISIHPNPAKNDLFVNGLSGTMNMEIYDELGRIVMSVPATNKTNVKINLSKLETGTYQLLISDKAGAVIQNFKLVKSE